MDNIPIEILHHIALHLASRDVPNFRLVCRSFASIGLVYLDIGEHFYMREHSLERLDYIASHHSMRRNLRKITFFVDIVPSSTQSDWEAKAYTTCHSDNGGQDDFAVEWLKNYRFNQSIPVSALPDKFKEKGWHDQQIVRDEQVKLLDPCSNIWKVLQKSLSQLPNLSEFHQEAFKRHQSALTRPLFTVDKKQDWYCYNHTRDFDSFRLVAVQLLSAVLASRELIPALNPHLSIVDVYSIAFDGLRMMGYGTPDRVLKHVQTLHIKPVSFGSDANLRLIYNAMEGPDAIFRDANDESIENFLQKCLAQMDSLQFLSLDMYISPNLRTQPLLQDCRWKRLSVIKLCSTYIHVPSFKEFLKLHASSLKELHLWSTELGATGKEHAWIDLFQFMKYNLDLVELDVGGILLENDGEVEFNDEAAHEFESGMILMVKYLARSLVCGRYPSGMVVDASEWASISWQDLLSGYV